MKSSEKCEKSERKRIVEEVLQAEEKVDVVIREAHARASEIKRLAEEEISEKTNEAKQKARELIQTVVEGAKKDAERIRLDKLRQADQEREALFNSKTDAIDSLVDNICNIILTTEHDKDSE
jgi:vacuolar-type H+-ATPase subunit H